MVVVAGLVLLVISPAIAPYGWVAPLTVAAGLLLGQCRDTASDRRAGLRHKAIPFFAAAVFLLLGTDPDHLAARRAGRQGARS
ncbi:hypothetical protein [Streptomyces sp. NPDC058086]|uniref:hypothetical protein n=1 Tax=Streptomyces sp. NPDC058086 TaxID=3346334 RepID=UPI0036ECA1F6